jgi:hypothetical protein
LLFLNNFFDPIDEYEVLFDSMYIIGFSNNLELFKTTIVNLKIEVPKNFFELICKKESNVSYNLGV